MDVRTPEQQYNPYRVFTRAQWAHLRDDTPMTLEPGEFSRLSSLHDRLDLKEVEEIYLPLSRLLSIYVDATQRLYYAQRQFLGIRDRKVPYIIGVAGSVAVTLAERAGGVVIVDVPEGGFAAAEEAMYLTRYARSGVNKLEVEVTNTRANELAADDAKVRELQERGWLTNSYIGMYLKFDKEMIPSGLLGPVRILSGGQ